MSKETRPLLPTWASTLITSAAFLTLFAVTWSVSEQNRILKDGRAPTRTAQPVISLDSGDELQDIGLLSVEGKAADLVTALDGGGVVVVFTTTCPYCEATMPTWGKLQQQASENGWPFLAVSLHDAERTQAYLSRHRMDWEAWTPASAKDRAALNIRIVPTTAVVDETGRVTALWRGELDETHLGQIQVQLRAIGKVARTDGGSILGSEYGRR